MAPHTEDEYFIPAQSPAEAIARIFALAGATPQNRGEKRALLALRDALSLDVDVVRTNAVLGQRIADKLGVDWIPVRHTVRNKVSLAGLNTLLSGAAVEYRRGSLDRVRDRFPPTLVGPQWASFQPAVSKIEAVTRIASLTDAPREWLGPGSKEHKSVLTNLADRLLPETKLDRSSKTRLGRSLAEELGVVWTDDCASTGETISLIGLNTILAGSEYRLNVLGSTAAEVVGTPLAEGSALAAAINDGWKARPWDGRESISWMQQRGTRGPNENEWQGWFFEARAREILAAAFPPSQNVVRTRYANTTFDYSLNFVWDLKAHTEEQFFPVSRRTKSAKPTAILNDELAIRQCVAEQGLGFLILGGRAVMDEDGRFLAWHREFKAEQGRPRAHSNSGKSRLRKTAFSPLHVEAFWVADTLHLNTALASGQLSVKSQGRQAPREAGAGGAARKTKFHMNVQQARTSLRISRRDWNYK